MMLYFAYGSNMWRARIEARLGPCGPVTTAWVEGYRLRFHKTGRDRSGKCDASETRCAADRLYGVVFELSDSQKIRLDDIEGPGYVSKSVLVQSRSGARQVDLYVAAPDHIDPSLSPFDWYKAFVLYGAVDAAFPPGYVRDIDRIFALIDSDSRRAAENYALLERLRTGSVSRRALARV